MKSRDEIRAFFDAHLKHCDFCPKKCGANRLNGETGVCGACDKPRIYQHFVHMGEEITLVPAFVINFANCNLRCVDCPERARWQDPAIPVGNAEHYAIALAHHFTAHDMPESIEWIGGEPSPELRFVVETSWKLKELLPDCPPVYLNTNGYFNPDLFDCMEGAIDGFVFDLKACSGCALQLCGARDYWPVVTANICNAIARFSIEMLIVRHLVVPGHVDCCTKPVIDWCRHQVPQATFNLMTTYRSFGANAHGETALSLDEAEKAKAFAVNAGFESLLINGEYT